MVSMAYDLVIIGGGAAGLMAASFGVQLGARVALVEKHRIGGDCTWTGCVPSKALLRAAKAAHEMRTAARYGLPSIEPAVNLKAVLAQVGDVISSVYEEESPEVLRDSGIDVYLGAARFLDSNRIVVGDDTLTARRTLIATGAHPHIPSIRGLDQVDFLTSESLWELEELPPRLLIVGAGPVGVEMAQAFQRLGSQVTLLASRGRLLPRDDPEASRTLGKVFEAEGINIVYSTRAELAWQDQAGIHVGAGGRGLVGDALLMATGRRPNVDGMGLENAGVLFGPDGVQVDGYLRTSQRQIYAAGDVTGGPQFTHYAGWQAAMAVRNALLPGASQGTSDLVPWTTFTDPEVAHVGLTEEKARERQGDDVRTCDWPMARVDRARTDGDTAGFMKLVHHRNGTLLGATIVAGRAGEMIHEWLVVLQEGIKIADLSNAIHVYPTYSVAGMQAASEIRINQFLNGTSGKVARSLARLSR
jgi:pyruvate/2-oxoglutarate dehydrogenase complex dihydrolipoamide dehydrogenase (E3) component